MKKPESQVCKDVVCSQVDIGQKQGCGTSNVEDEVSFPEDNIEIERMEWVEDNTMGANLWEKIKMAFSWNDNLLAAASRDRTASVWNVPKGKHLYDVERKNMGIQWIGFSADDSLFLTSSHSTSEAWNANDGTMVGSIESIARAAGYLEDRTLLAIGDDADNTLIKWNSIDATSEVLWPGMIGYPVAISRDEQLLAVYVRDLFIDDEWKEIYRVEVWDLPSKTKLTSIDGVLAEGYTFTPANDALLITLYRGGLRREAVQVRMTLS